MAAWSLGRGLDGHAVQLSCFGESCVIGDQPVEVVTELECSRKVQCVERAQDVRIQAARRTALNSSVPARSEDTGSRSVARSQRRSAGLSRSAITSLAKAEVSR
jgi:hypothetical protein